MVLSSQRDDFLRGAQKILANEALKAVHVIAQQLGVVVEHLLEVRNDPALVHAVAMESAGELVVDAAARHLFQGGDERVPRLLVVAIHRDFEQQVEGRGMRKLGLRTEAAVAGIELRQDGAGDLIHERQGKLAATAGEALVVLDGGHDAGRRIRALPRGGLSRPAPW